MVEKLYFSSISRPLTIYCDNFDVVYFSQINKDSKDSKHFDAKYMFVREKVQEFQIRIEKSTRLMVEDPLTKRLSIKVFQIM